MRQSNNILSKCAGRLKISYFLFFKHRRLFDIYGKFTFTFTFYISLESLHLLREWWNFF